MPKYVIEREFPSAGKLTAEQLKGIALISNAAIEELGPRIQWVDSYITADKIYCVYIASNKDIILEHAKKGGFPANAVNEVATIINPTTAD